MRPSAYPVTRAVLLALLWGGFGAVPPAAAQFTPALQGVIASPCTLDVVLVTFQDATSKQTGWSYDYHNYDLPHGYSIVNGKLTPGDNSYKLVDFKRLFGTSDAAAFSGKGVRVGGTGDDGEELPELFGSVRAYFEAVSGGRFDLQVRVINPQDENGYPRWVQLPETKGFYAEIRKGTKNETQYWDDAHTAAMAAIRGWYPGSTEYDLPDATADVATRQSHKVLYLHSGAEFSDNDTGDSILHPRVDVQTSVTPAHKPQNREQIGFRYVAAERRGARASELDKDSWNRFTGIGIHVHEIGHLLGLPGHLGGRWCGRNEYEGQTSSSSVVFPNAKLLAWCSMSSGGAQGPPVWKTGETDSAWVQEYRSCPAPYSAPYRHDLGWNTRIEVTGTTQDQRIKPGDYVVFQTAPETVGALPSEILLELRGVGFGQYAGWHRFAEAPGVLMWKVRQVLIAGAVTRNPRLIPADGRSIRDARRRPETPDPGAFTGLRPGLDRPPLRDTRTYSWQDLVSDPFDALEGNGLPTDFALPMPAARRPVVTQADDSILLRASIGRSCPHSDLDPPTRRAIRNIRVNRDASPPYADVDIYFDHWVGSIAGMETWSGPDTVYMGGDVTIESGASLTIANNTPVRFLSPVGADANGRPELIVASGGRLSLGSGVTFGTVDRAGARTEMYGLRVETGGTATLNGVTLPEGTQHWSGQTGPAALRLATFGSSSYTLIEGGQTVEAGPIGLAEDPSQASRRTRVTVQLTPAASARVRIPVEVTSRSSGYKVGNLDAAGLLFPADSTSASFVIRAERDTDTVDARIELSFGTLPAGVVAGVPSTSTVTVYDTPNQPTGLTATPGHGQMTLQWDNPDNPRITGWQYWARPVPGQGTWTTIDPSGASTTEYTVPNLANGKEYMFRVRAYTRGYGLTSQSVEAIPTGLRATAYNGAVGLDWVDPEIADLSGWRSRHRPVPGDWSSYTVHAGGAGTRVVRNLTNDQKYRFEVQGLDAEGQALDRETCTWSGGRPCTWQALATPMATLPPPPNRKPALSGPDSVWYAEGGQDSVARYPATDADEDGLRWSLGGVDAADLTVRGDTLFFRSAPDYEQPRDRSGTGAAAGDNVYQITMSVSDGRASDGTEDPAADTTMAVVVTVTNVNEAGEVSLSSRSPEAGTELRATLSDPDGSVSDTTWQWQASNTSPADWVDRGTRSRYTPTPSDVGYDLRATVGYRDAHGPRQSAASASIGPVTGNRPPPPPSGPTSVSYAENRTDSVATYTLSDPDGDTGLTLQLGGLDKAAFRVSGDTLYFRNSPNYEQPSDYGSNNTYVVSLQTHDGSLSSTPLAVTVTVTNVNEAGEVSLSSRSPEAGTALTATLSDPDGSVSDTTWQWQASNTSPADWVDRGTRSRYTPTPSDVGYDLRATVGYRDAHGPGQSAASASIGPVTGNRPPPPPSGPTSVSYAENRTDSVATYTLSDPDGDTGLTLQLGGLDKAAFRVSGDTLYFRNSPNYEQPSDYGSNNTYVVSLQTHDGSLSSTPLAVTVTVTNVNEAGEVSLSSRSPEAGTELRATLSDPDGSVSDTTWQWQASNTSPADWTSLTSSDASTSRYTPTPSDVGYDLRATVGYRDAHGPRQSAASASIGPVTGNRPPPPPSGPTSVSYAENRADSVATYTLSDPDGDTGLTLQLGGLDKAAFRVSGTRCISGARRTTSSRRTTARTTPTW